MMMVGPNQLGMDPRMMDERMVDPRRMMDPRMRGIPPQQQFQPPMQQGSGQQPPPQQGQQSQQQQQQQPTFYDILQVPPTASRSQIKQSYLQLAKQFDNNAPSGIGSGGMDNNQNVGPQRGSGRRSRQFNEIARAWMVLSDSRSRERYDRQLEQWDAERRMREKMMEEERMWMIEMQGDEQQWGSGGGGGNNGGGGGDDENKFVKKEVDNKFARFGPLSQRSMGRSGRQGFGGGGGGGTARPLEIDEEAEEMRMQQQMQMQMQEDSYMAQ